MAPHTRIIDRWLAVGVLIAGFVLALPLPKLASQPAQQAVFEHGDLVAHALGGIGGRTYTNSLDAFQSNYRKGRRTFEVDLSMTSDGQLVGLHDWSPRFLQAVRIQAPIDEEERPLSHREFMRKRIFNRYAPADLKGLMKLLSERPDARLITDTKSISGQDVASAFSAIVEEARRADPNLPDRIIPQIYNQRMFEAVREVYPFRSFIYALYLSPDSDDEAIRFMTAKGIRAVSMPYTRATPGFLARLKDAGIYIYVHTVNDPVRARRLLAEGADGLYTDTLFPANL